MILLCNNNGFSNEYSRSRNDVYIEKEQLEVETTEPLQCLMEKSTKYNYWERIDMEGCLRFIDDQLKAIRGNIPEQTLMKWKYDEQIKRLNETVHPDEIICKDPSEIIKILDAMAETADLVFVEAGKEYSSLPFIRARYVENNLYDIDILNVYYLGRRKTIEFAIDGISLKRDVSCEIYSNTYRFDMKPIPTFDNVDAALKCTDRFVRINTKCKIRMVRLGSAE